MWTIQIGRLQDEEDLKTLSIFYMIRMIRSNLECHDLTAPLWWSTLRYIAAWGTWKATNASIVIVGSQQVSVYDIAFKIWYSLKQHI